MKSSTKVAHSALIKRDVLPWKPIDLQDDSHPTINPNEVERLVSIFKPVELVLDSSEAKEILGTHLATEITEWTPDDLGFQPIQLGIPEDYTTEGQSYDFPELVQDIRLTQEGKAEISADETRVEAKLETEYISPVITDVMEGERILEEAQKQTDLIYRRRLAEAQQQADEIIQNASTRVEAARQQGYLDGYGAGQSDIQSSVEAAKSMLEQFSAWRAEMLTQSEATVMGLVQDIAAKLFSDGFELDKMVLRQAFSEILVTARALGDLRVYVNAEDSRKLDPQWREYQVLISGQRIQILPTDAIKKGGCYIEGQRGSVDARIESQLKVILDSLSVEPEG
jgi:flagellar biosynthesis/type III secretory pathway protein FliH